MQSAAVVIGASRVKSFFFSFLSKLSVACLNITDFVSFYCLTCDIGITIPV